MSWGTFWPTFPTIGGFWKPALPTTITSFTCQKQRLVTATRICRQPHSTGFTGHSELPRWIRSLFLSPIVSFHFSLSISLPPACILPASP